MILVVKMLTDTTAKKLWEGLLRHKDAMQEALGKKGKLLYLTKRMGYNEACLFVHATDSAAVIDLILAHISRIEGLTAICIAHLFRPRFFPVPEDTYDLKRFVVTAKVSPRYLSDAYQKLLNPTLPKGISRVYYAFTFHLYDDSLQYSFLADSEETAQKYVAEHINTIRGIIIADTHQIERTKAFITYKEWKKYTTESEKPLPNIAHLLNDFR
jgi:hypothetical protein